MEAQYINPFIKAIHEVLGTMGSIKPKMSKPYLKKDAVATGDVSTIVGLTGDPNGTVSISFDEGSILQIASALFMEEMKELDREVADVAGEIANMVSGQARREIEEVGRVLDGSIPTIIRGPDHNIIHLTDGPKIAIPFRVDKGAFVMEVCFEY